MWVPAEPARQTQPRESGGLPRSRHWTMIDVVPPRIPPLAAEDREPEVADLLAGFRNLEGNELNIFATLGRHPSLLRRWAAFGFELLGRGRLDARDRELLILRTGYLCRAPYEWAQHVEIARAAGLDDAEVERVADGPDAAGWSVEDASLLRAADELHHDSRIGDDTWALLAERFDDQQLIEVCMVVGQYHLVAFTVNSLGVELESSDLPELPG